MTGGRLHLCFEHEGRLKEVPTQHVYRALALKTPEDALSVCENYLQLDQSNDALRALRAFVLLHCGRVVEGSRVADAIAAQNPTDLEVLETLDRVYMALERPDRSAVLFERACKAMDWHETYASLWFTGLVRLCDYRGMLSLSLKIHSQTKSDQYVFWAMSSLLLQADASAEATEKGRLLRLAENMLVRLKASSASFTGMYEQLIFAVDLCRKLGNHSLALDMFSSAPTDIFPDGNQRTLLHLSLLLQAGQFDRAASMASSLMRANGITDWCIWETFIQCFNQGDLHCAVKYAEVWALLREIDGMGDLRTHLLAAVDASVRLSPFVDDFIAHISSYVAQFYTHRCCVDDMCHVVRTLLSSDQAKLLLEYACGRTSGDPRYDAVWLNIARVAGHRHKHAGLCAYSAAVSKFLAAEVGNAAEDVLILAALLSVDSENTLRAIECLSLAINRNPDNFMAMLMQVICLRNAGAIFAARDVYTALNIKEIQLDTLSYILLDDMVDFGALEDASTIIEDALSFYDDSRTQSWRLMVEAFRSGRYSSICNFAEFNRRLDSSIQAIAFIVASVRCDVFAKSAHSALHTISALNPSELLIDAAQYLRLADNRDLDVLDFCDPAGTLRSNISSARFSALDLAFYSTQFFLLQSLSLTGPDRLKLTGLILHSANSLIGISTYAWDEYQQGKHTFATSLLNVLLPCIASDGVISATTLNAALTVISDTINIELSETMLTVSNARSALLGMQLCLSKLRFVWLAAVAANTGFKMQTDIISTAIRAKLTTATQQLRYWSKYLHTAPSDLLRNSWQSTIERLSGIAGRMLK